MMPNNALVEDGMKRKTSGKEHLECVLFVLICVNKGQKILPRWVKKNMWTNTQDCTIGNNLSILRYTNKVNVLLILQTKVQSCQWVAPLKRNYMNSSYIKRKCKVQDKQLVEHMNKGTTMLKKQLKAL